MSNRTQERQGFSDTQRIILLEQDADRIDRHLDQIRDQIEQATKKMGDEVKALRGVLTGILVSLATASVLLAVNLVAGLG